ncbi:MAG: hypothetical protein A3J24_05095 [Deltaproteobacteria bacterium RIFCSPLOWO2_02_FULL_53_8]|nr:MAG: hypothetical protein A3J24_05095 [Deltaproteobacteria bacterium RIFCSPLOWO2_02_FULL_53_8]
MKRDEAARLDRDRLIEEHLYLVKVIAHQVAVNLPAHIDVGDLIGAGMVGLIEAINRFDTDRGVQLNTYASIRVRGAILDELRSMDWMTRSMRDKSNSLTAAYAQVERRIGRPAEIDEVAKVMDVSIDELHSLLSEVASLSVINLDDLGVKGTEQGFDMLECITDPNCVDPYAAAKLTELKKIVADSVKGLPEIEKVVISLYYYEELTLKEIGKVLDISESRVCQLHTQTIHRLKARLKLYKNE